MKLRSAQHGLLALTLLLSCKSGEGGVAGVLVVSSVDVQPGITDVVLGTTRQLTATPKTSSGIAVPGRSVVWSSTDPLIASVSGSGLVSGVALGGPVRIRATVDGVVGDALLTVRPVPIDRITVTPPNSGVLVGAGVQLTAKAFDAAGGELPGRSFLWESSAPAIAAVTTTGIAIGLAQGGPVTISAIAEGKTGTALVSVSTRPATRLAFMQQPGPSVAGVALAPPIQIALQDDLLTTVVGAANPVTISLAGNPGGATLSGTTTLNATSGLATFSNLSLNKPGIGYTFLVTSPGLSAATSTPFNVTVGAAAKLAFTTPLPGSAQSGVPFGPQPVLQLQDAVGNPVPQSGVVVTATLQSGSGSIGGTTTATTNSAGVASFSNLSLSGPAGTYTLSFGAPGITPVISGLVTLGSGVAQSLAISIQPTSSAQSGVPLSQQPAIQLKDAAGNNAAQSGVVITAAIESGGGTLGGATTATTNVNGLAQFATLAINGAAGNYTLRFTAPGVTGVTSSTIVLGAGAPTQLGMVTQPSPTAASGAAFAQQPSVRLRDGGGNQVAVAGVQITAAITSGTGTLLGTATAATNASGVATFTNLGISGPVGSYTLTFTSSGLTSVISTAITLGAGAANNLGLTTQPSAGGASGVAFAQQPVVRIRDAALNFVSQAGVVVTAAIASGPAGGTLSGTLTATTSATGTATFTNLSISGPSGTYTLGFTAPGLTQAASGGITLGAGAPTAIAANSVTTQSGTVSAAVAAPPSVKVTDGSGNPVAGVAVTFAVTGGGGTIVPAGPGTVSTNALGIATATSWTLGPAAGTNNNTATATVAGLTGSPVTFTASGTSGTANTIAANSVTSQSATVGTAVAAPPSVRVSDAGNNPVAGVAVTFAVTAGGGTVVPAGPATVTTNALGIATATSWTLGTGAGTNNHVVTATAAVPNGSPVTFTASGVAGAANTIAANSATTQSAAVGAAVTAPPSARVTDANGNPKAGVAVTFTVTAGGGSINPASPAVINTDAAGVATLTSWTLGNSAGTNTVTASATVPNGSPVTFNATGTALAANAIAANSTTNQSATVGTAVAAPPSVRVTDINGNGVAGVSVAFAVSGGGGSIVPASPAIMITNASGVATLTSWTLGTTAGTNTVTATASVSTGSPVTFTATGLAGAANTIAANSVTTQSTTVGTNVGAPPSVRVTDANANPKSGVAVTFTLTAGGGSIIPGSPAVINTDVNGVATLTSWTVGGSPGTNNNTVTASAAVPNGSPVTFNASGTTGTANAIAANSATTQSATVGSAVAAPPSVLVTDAGGNPKSGIPVTFAVTAGGGSLGAPLTVNSDVNGIATVASWTLGTTAGTNNNTVTASAAVPNGSPVTFTASGVAGPANTIAANSATTQSAAVGTAVGDPPSARVTDASGNPKAGIAVTFTVTAGGGSINPASPATINTDAAGVATLTSWTLGNSAGANTVTATAAVPSGSPVTFNATGTAATAHAIAANSTTNQSATVGTAVAAPPSVLVTDINGNGVPGVAVAFVITGGGGSSSPASPAAVNTNASGIATLGSWTLGGVAGVNTLTASASVTTGSPVTFNATGTAGAAAGSTSTITASPTSITANGSSTSTISVQLKDAGSNNLTSGGAAVVLATTAGNLTAVTDNGNGTYTATLTGSTSVETATITGTVNGAAITDNATVGFTAVVPSASTSTITASPTSIAANGSSTSTISVQLKDAGSNNLTSGGATVALATTAGSLSAVTDNGNGTYTATLTSSTSVETATITGTLNGAAITDNATVSFTAGAPSASTSTITASPTSIAADGISTSTITVQLKDAGSNDLTTGGATVALATTTGSLGAVTDNGNGTYTATLTSSTSTGTATITGTLNGTPITDNATVTFTVGAASASTSTITASPTSIAADGITTSTITTQLKDAGSNDLTSGGATVALATTTGSLGAVTDNGNGTYTATLTSSTTAGTATITGTLNGTPITDNATVTFTVGAASTATSTITAAPTSIAGDGTSTSTITVQLKDANSNNLTSGGATVALATTAGSLSAVTDNGNGTYTATLTSSATIETATITGTLNGAAMAGSATVSFTADMMLASTSTIAVSSGPRGARRTRAD